jgi:hypothetical protein
LVRKQSRNLGKLTAHCLRLIKGFCDGWQRSLSVQGRMFSVVSEQDKEGRRSPRQNVDVRAHPLEHHSLCLAEPLWK